MSGLSADQLERGRCYRSTTALTPAPGGAEIILICSVGPRWVRYRSWDDEWSARIHRHPRILFDSWDGTWVEVEDPSS